MSELALQRIRENIQKHQNGEDARFLDLGNCGMTEVPEEIGACTWVEELVLSAVSTWITHEYMPSIKQFMAHFNVSENRGASNYIKRLPFSISQLTSLKKIILVENPISDLSPLANLTNLQYLNLYKTLIKDLSPLAGLINLEGIDCADTPIANIDSLANLINLESIDFKNTQISDISALANLINLETASHPVTTAGLSIWRTGMVLHKPNIFDALARVRWDKEDQKLLVDVCGEERRRFLSFIRETVKEIVGTFANLKFNELVPIPDSSDTEEYDYLVEAEKAGEKEVFVKSLKKRVAIADLLNGVEEPAMRDEVEQMPVRAFVSYSHKDMGYLPDLHAALSPLVRLQKLQLWDDHDIKAGDTWEEVLFQQLAESDIVLCLVSADFVASDFCYKKEFGAALEAHQRGDKTIVPIMLRQTDWSDLPLATITGTPGDEWIASATDKDAAWTKVSESLRPALERAKQRRKRALDAVKMRH